MDLGIAGKTAFVAGGSKGIGRSVALKLAEEGCRVAVVARGQEAIDGVVAEIVANGGQAVGVSLDLSTQEGVERAVQTTRDALGSPEIVTIPTLLYAALGQDFVRPNAAVLSLILVVPNVLLMLILEKLLKSANPTLSSGKG